MADIEGQTTDRTIVDTNPNTPRVVHRGTVTINLSASGSIYAGATAVNIEFLQGTILNPAVFAYRYETGVGFKLLKALPYTDFNTDGTLNRSLGYDISIVGTTDESLDVNFYAQADNNTSITIYFAITTMSISLDSTLLANP